MAVKDQNVFGIAATFRTAPDVYHACEKVRDAGYKRWDSYTPFPIHGIDKAMGLKRSKVPIFTFFGGMTGFLTG
ncbi:MAG: quinol:electron acceptor oxidoreductase subunit ActD, partial [Puniceicoccales bacterium]